jgi:predicted HNH restriction endonuclease
MPNGIARRLSEPDLILPALLVLDEGHGPVSTTQLSERLRNLLKPSGEDVVILAGRQDDKFSQKVRNLKSHKTLEAPGYARYESRGRQGYWQVTELGQRVLEESSDFIRVALDPGFTSAVITQALSRLNYTNPNRIPRIYVFDEDEAVKEGARSQAQRTVYERSRRLRDAAVAYYASQGALQCEVCGFSFERTYGDLGRGFIEIHHKKPIFCLDGQGIEQAIARAIRDVAALCANCHRIVHRKRNAVLSIEELRSLLDGRGRVQEETRCG